MPRRGTSWVAKKDQYSRTDDEGFFAHWKPVVEGIAKRMIVDYRLSSSNFEDFLSDGMLALNNVPQEARWNANYVRTAIRSKLITQLHSAKTRRLRLEYWDEYKETPSVVDFNQLADFDPTLALKVRPLPVAPDGIDMRLTLKACVDSLEGTENIVVRLQLAGLTEREIGQRLKLETAKVKQILASALSHMQTTAGINQGEGSNG